MTPMATFLSPAQTVGRLVTAGSSRPAGMTWRFAVKPVMNWSAWGAVEAGLVERQPSH